MSSLLCYSVYDSCCGKTLIPWTIHDLKDERLSFESFYGQECYGAVMGNSEENRNYLLKEVRVGMGKENLDPVKDTGKTS